MDDLLREMITPPAPRRDPARRRRVIGTAAILGMAGLGLTTLVTSAVFTDNDDTGRSGIVTGTVDIEAGEDVAFTLPPGNLAPGDSIHSPVTVNNAGSLALTYGVQYSATSPDGKDLAGVLAMDLFAVADAAACSEAGLTGATPIGTAGPGLATSTTPLTTTDRGLIANASELLCVRVTVPDIGNEYQDSRADLTLTFAAQQDPVDPHR
ncbi:TasA family protein [Cellulomonas sp. NPDC089187]|uniref:TasA family protein n=1 Tax=Cellulomonas sp. NPDC089187 TaxID=3154970 RepID=UPI0034490F7D